jgi:MFS family permease
MRFLLGVAEAGFFPGMILYFTYWFPKAYRARVISALFIAVPGSNAVAAVFSGAILDMDGSARCGAFFVAARHATGRPSGFLEAPPPT